MSHVVRGMRTRRDGPGDIPLTDPEGETSSFHRQAEQFLEISSVVSFFGRTSASGGLCT